MRVLSTIASSLYCLRSSTRIILIYIKTKIMRCNIMYYASVRPCVVFLEIIIFMVSCMLYTNTRAHGAITSCSNSHFLLANCEYFDSLKGVDFLSDFFLVYYVMYVQKTKATDCTHISGPFHFWAPYFWHWGKGAMNCVILISKL